ncbi:MAG TPA: hypothetical protein VLD16_01540 [Gaiellaceae bacterium]|nr:hypothetical protein [Gaiellaceae bacterium]
MRTSFRLALLVGACFAGLAFAAPSFAAYTPSLIIEQSSYKVGAASTADVFLAIGTPNNPGDPTAKMTIFSPPGYQATLTAAPGTKIGSVAAVVMAKALGGGILPLSGNVLVANPVDPTIQLAATQCTGTATHTTIWVLNTSLQGQTVAIPVFVDSRGPLVTMQVCLPSPDVPEASGGAKFGAQLLAADFTIKNVFTNAGTKGGYEWASDFTPYTPGTATPNPLGTQEARTYVGLPTTLTLKRAKAKRGFALVGKLFVQGVSPAGIRVDLYAGKKPQPAPNAVSAGKGKRVARSAKLKARGTFTFVRPNVKFATYFQARFENYTTDCSGASPSGQPIPCREERIAAVTSNQIKVLKPKPRKHR